MLTAVLYLALVSGQYLDVFSGLPPTWQAAVVLPSALWVEKNGMYGNSERRTQQWFKMVNPPGEARDDCWQTIAVARKLFDLGHPGINDKDGKFLFTFKNAAVPSASSSHTGITGNSASSAIGSLPWS